MFIKAMTKWVSDNVTGVSVTGASKNLYAGYPPTSIDSGATYVLLSSPYGGTREPTITQEYHWHFQVLAAAADYYTAANLAALVNDALHGRTNFDITSGESEAATYTVIACIAIQQPSDIGRDESSARHQFVQNFRATINNP